MDKVLVLTEHELKREKQFELLLSKIVRNANENGRKISIETLIVEAGKMIRSGYDWCKNED